MSQSASGPHAERHRPHPRGLERQGFSPGSASNPPDAWKFVGLGVEVKFASRYERQRSDALCL
jgi:hypothetical protein